MKKLFLIVFSLVFFFLPNAANSQTLSIPQATPSSPEGWYINSLNSDIEITPDGSVDVAETITVDFKNLEKHGIFRDIPVIYRGSEGDIYTEIDIIQILQDNESAEYETYRSGDFLEIKIGDPDKTISGIHTYQISYNARGILRSFGDYDELYWNVTGNDWPVPILAASATVKLPQDGIVKFKCFEGPTGSQITECQTQQINDRELSVKSSRPLNVYEGLTVVLGYQPGMVPILIVEKPKTLLEQFMSPHSLVLFGLATIAGIGSILVLWFRRGRDFHFNTKQLFDPNAPQTAKPIGKHETIVVEYTPPEKLRPAELGVLVDEKADTLDVTATIIDLAGRGFLSIREIPKKWMFGKVDYELSKKDKKTDELLPYEKELLTRLFDEGDKVTISSLKKKFYSDLAKVKTQLYKDVQEKKLFAENPEGTRSFYGGISVVPIIVGILLSVIGINTQIVYLLDVGAAIVIASVVLIIMSRHMPRRTALGRELYRRVRGYRHFIETAETHKQKFFENKNLFNEVLPYAIVFGLTEKFAKAMRDIGIEPNSPSWYLGSRPFNTAVFASDISDFSSSFSSAIASTPSSGGGFSGGGSSGGGFGGGGGGSW